ncbi:hypothetical protein Tco_1063213 [Tanacetum coccineum]
MFQKSGGHRQAISRGYDAANGSVDGSIAYPKGKRTNHHNEGVGPSAISMVEGAQFIEHDEAALSGDREAYAPEFNQLRADMMMIITMHKAFF